MLKDQKSTREEEFKSAQTSVVDMVALPLHSSIHPACLCFILIVAVRNQNKTQTPKILHLTSALLVPLLVLCPPLRQVPAYTFNDGVTFLHEKLSWSVPSSNEVWRIPIPH